MSSCYCYYFIIIIIIIITIIIIMIHSTEKGVQLREYSSEVWSLVQKVSCLSTL